MAGTFSIKLGGWKDGERIPPRFAFCAPSEQHHVALSENVNPAVSWADAPQGTKSFALICHDPDVPSSLETVNKEGMTVPKDLTRITFYHWVLVDIPASVSSIDEGADSSSVTPKGKPPGKRPYGVAGINSYTNWFAGDDDMQGDYGGYDGPCPPWNDSIPHHYHFTVYALDVESLGLKGRFGGAEALTALQGHVLAETSVLGVYSLNPEV